jgi:hypothetical protein
MRGLARSQHLNVIAPERKHPRRSWWLSWELEKETSAVLLLLTTVMRTNQTSLLRDE